jgi:hypothetical protein
MQTNSSRQAASSHALQVQAISVAVFGDLGCGFAPSARAALTLVRVAYPRQAGWSQWHARAVTFLESWQIWLQYLFLSGAMQLQAGCAHFLVSAIPLTPHIHRALIQERARFILVTSSIEMRFSQHRNIFPPISTINPANHCHVVEAEDIFRSASLWIKQNSSQRKRGGPMKRLAHRRYRQDRQ